jgi:hypothetical protein
MDGALIFISEMDTELGKIAKKPRLNPLGENAYLRADGTIERDETKIIAVQRRWKHEYYKPDGPAFQKGLKNFERLQRE